MRTFAEKAAWRDYEEGRGPKPEIKAPLGRHTRKCTVCNHPEREAIEEEFLRWRSPKDIADDYGFSDYSSIYRHARAAGARHSLRQPGTSDSRRSPAIAGRGTWPAACPRPVAPSLS